MGALESGLDSSHSNRCYNKINKLRRFAASSPYDLGGADLQFTEPANSGSRSLSQQLQQVRRLLYEVVALALGAAVIVGPLYG